MPVRQLLTLPGGDGESSVRADHAPKLLCERNHVGDKENPEDAGHHVEARVGIIERQHVADPEFEIAEPLLARLCLSQADEPLSEIDRDDIALSPDSFSGGQRRAAAPAAHIQNRLTLAQAEPRDGLPSETMPEGADRMIKIIRRGVVCGGGFGVRLFERPPFELANSFDDSSCSVAAFAGLFHRLARLLVHLLAGSVAIGANVLASAGCSRVWIIVRGVMAKWIF